LVKYRVIGAVLGTLLPIVTWAQGSWLDDQTVQRQLADGEVAVIVKFEGDGSRVQVNAAVRIKATRQIIWDVLTDCDHAASFIPGVKRCRRVQTAADGSWEIIEQESKYSWLMPSVVTVVHADYTRHERIDFKKVSGDLKEQQGAWLVEKEEHSAADTLTVEYELHVEPGFWIPRVLVRHSLRTELPAALAAVRARAEQTASTQ
ncbi:MAG TPA: SRPBCC family protein, partial [Steroidobacteraceae bacterium]